LNLPLVRHLFLPHAFFPPSIDGPSFLFDPTCGVVFWEYQVIFFFSKKAPVLTSFPYVLLGKIALGGSCPYPPFSVNIAFIRLHAPCCSTQAGLPPFLAIPRASSIPSIDLLFCSYMGFHNSNRTFQANLSPPFPTDQIHTFLEIGFPACFLTCASPIG